MFAKNRLKLVLPQLGTYGFSVTEMLVVMVIFLTVIMISSRTFETIANQTSQQAKSVESNIEGVIGLEVLRADLVQSGFGLPWEFTNDPLPSLYTESAALESYYTGLWPGGFDFTQFNDRTSISVSPPRAVQVANTEFNKDSSGVGSKYLVLKATNIATNNVAKRWTTVAYFNGGKAIRVWHDTKRDFDTTDRVIVVKNNLNATPQSRQLMVKSDGVYSAPFSNYSTLITSHRDGDTFEVYGISTGTSAFSSLGMPFNRADYYIVTPSKMPGGCAPHTGVLYKSNIAHSSSGGSYSPLIPLLDCVADMQFVFGLDTSGAGNVNFHTSNLAAAGLTNSAAIRTQLREIRAYILVQDGRRDITYTNPSKFVDVGESFDGGATILGRRVNLENMIGSGWDKYRWKVYTIVVAPLNLIQ